MIDIHGYMIDILLLSIVIKFKRRTKFLEYFVKVLEKAYTEGTLQKILDWSNDTEHWFCK